MISPYCDTGFCTLNILLLNHCLGYLVRSGGLQVVEELLHERFEPIFEACTEKLTRGKPLRGSKPKLWWTKILMLQMAKKRERAKKKSVRQCSTSDNRKWKCKADGKSETSYTWSISENYWYGARGRWDKRCSILAIWSFAKEIHLPSYQNHFGKFVSGARKGRHQN